MADMNRWVAKRQADKLREVRGDAQALQALCVARDEHDHGQRHMAARVMQLLDQHIAVLEGARQDAEQMSFSSDDIDEGLKA